MADSRARVSTVQVRSKFSVLRCIPVDVRVEKKQIAASNFHAPDLRSEGAAWSINLNHDGFAIGADGRLHRLLVDVRLEIFFLLPAVAVEPLQEIALAIKQTDADQRNIQVGCALDVVACEHTQSAGIDRK